MQENISRSVIKLAKSGDGKGCYDFVVASKTHY